MQPVPPPSPWRTGRWWLTTLVAGVLVAACVALGAWQFDRARTRDAPTTAANPMAAPAVQLVEALPADGRVLAGSRPRAVLVRGRYAAEDQFVVPGRTQREEPATYVVTPLVPSNGRAVLVVRGWLPPGAAVPAPPGGLVEVTGWLAPPEPLDAGTVDQLDLEPGELATLTAARAASSVDYPLVDGFIGLVDQRPASIDGATLQPLDVPVIDQGVRWSVQSLAYAVQWWIFAVIGLAMWVQALRLEHRPKDVAATSP